MFKWEYISPYVPIFWTKRFVKNRPCGLRWKLRSLKQKNRIQKRKPSFLIKDLISLDRRPYKPFAPQRRNYNTVYGRMQIPC